MRDLYHVHKVYHVAVTVSFNKYGSTNTLKKLLEAVSVQAAKILLHISKKIQKTSIQNVWVGTYKLHPAFHLKVYF